MRGLEAGGYQCTLWTRSLEQPGQPPEAMTAMSAKIAQLEGRLQAAESDLGLLRQTVHATLSSVLNRMATTKWNDAVMKMSHDVSAGVLQK